MTAPSYINRLRTEHADLMLRIDKAIQFTGTEEFADLPVSEQGLLIQQMQLMSQYGVVLGMRIAVAMARKKKV